MVLEKINQVGDIKQIPPEEYDTLAEEIRHFLVEKISRSGGHLASNLGVVELTMALHLCFDFPKDKVVWDVGHQSYTHKLLTGRKSGFDELRKYGGMSGFPKRKESDCDCFDTGHSSTSISAGIGLVAARDLQDGDEHVISVIGDGALTGGMAYEALNNASRLKRNFIIILNDNNMSIAENVGGMSEYLNGLRTNEAYTNFKTGVEQSLSRIPGGSHLANQLKKTKSGIKQLFIPGMLFENMGITYLGPVDGHDIGKLQDILNKAKKVKGAVLVHVLTRKGNGYVPAERHPARFHGAEPFDIETGLPLNKKKKANYQDVFSTCMVKLGQRNEKVVAITAAMPDGTGLKRFKNIYPDRFFDVGIAEGHAVTFAAGLAAGGMRPIFAVYSSFLQRAYDQVLHDVCIQNLPVVFAIDRAGLVGSDGETHQGIFDLSYLSTIPNMVVLSPKHKWELADMIRFGIAYDGPVAIRYPRGSACDACPEFRSPVVYGKSEILYEEREIAVIFVGHMFGEALEVRKQLKEAGYHCSLVNARFVKPLDTEMLDHLTEQHKLIVTIEENVRSGGFGEHVTEYLMRTGSDTRVQILALPDEYIEHGNVEVLRKETGLDVETMTAKIRKLYETL